MFATVIYSLKLGEDQAAHNYNYHVYGQGRVPISLVSVIKGNPNDRHEEFEHMIVDAVDWYRAALLGGLDIHREVLEMRDVVEQGVARLYATNDLVVLEKALSLMNQVPSIHTWKSLLTSKVNSNLFRPWPAAFLYFLSSSGVGLKAPLMLSP